mmetsp:Transcript_7547/g.13788  ORF Transcript_7547/g.13788 Transcript_7547/m.13788 type:complete len:1087 (-) Transcript_7547:2104-5364(-)
MDEWLKETRRLLGEEWQAENELAVSELDAKSRADLVRLGVTATSLTIAHVGTGLYGRTIASFERNRPGVLDTHGLDVGDIVRVVPNGGPSKKKGSQQEEAPSGIVSKVTELSIDVAFDDRTDDTVFQELRGLEPLRLDRLPNDATHKQQLAVLDRLGTLHPAHPAYHTAQVLFNVSKPLQHNTLPRCGNDEGDFIPFDQGLNEPQKQAIEFALKSRDIALIHGPPGTGKTTTVVELILQAACVYGWRVLVCAPSNVAVDNIVLRLATCEAVDNKKLTNNNKSAKSQDNQSVAQRPKIRQPLSMVRIGHPARLLPQVLRHSLDAVIKRADGTEIVQDVRKELNDVVHKLYGKKTAGKQKSKTKINYKELRQEVKLLRKELRVRESNVVKDVVKRANVVLCTNAGSTSILKRLRKAKSQNELDEEDMFDLVIIDEAAQAIEASCWIPILLGRRVVLAGDHKQLPPTIKSDVAARGLLGKTLFDRVVEMYGNSVVHMLNIQYRMHDLINNWASNAMYESKLVSAPSVASRKLRELPNVSASIENGEDEDDDTPTLSTLVMIDTAYCGAEEAVEGEGTQHTGSRFNQGEADIVAKHLEDLSSVGLKQEEIAVITPYNAQVHLLRSMLLEKYPKLEIRSVDGFQGREKEAVILSLVRSNPNGVVGFLSDDRRLNVAITRAKRHVCLVCDSETIRGASGKETFLGDTLDYFEEHALLLSAELYLEGCSAGGPMKKYYHVPSKKKGKGEKFPVMNKERKPAASDEAIAGFKKIIEEFILNGEPGDQYEFPVTISPGERYVVHELAETFEGLAHNSFGEGSERRVILEIMPRKISPQTTAPLQTVAPVQQLSIGHEYEGGPQVVEKSAFADLANDDESSSEDEDPSADLSKDDSTQTTTPANVEPVTPPTPPTSNTVPQKPKTALEQLREVQAQRYAEAKKKEAEAWVEKQPGRTKPKKGKGKKKKGPQKKKVATNAALPENKGDDMAFLDRVLSSSKVCAFKACDDSVQTIGDTCAFCKLKFCFKHGQAEVHGCGDHARKAARGEFKKTRPVDTKPLKSHQRSHLRRELDKKISEQAGKRAAKVTSKKSTKKQ